MKLKRTVLVATCVVAMSLLLLGASTAQAANVITDDNGNVIRIENLEVIDISREITVYNVDFRYESAIDVYESDLEFDFPISADALAADLAVRDALNAEDPVPPGAGPQGSDQFFIGSTERMGRVLAIGSENLAGFWDDCETDCIAGVAALDPGDPFTYADFTQVQDVPPGQATLISPSGTITDNTPTYTWNAVATATWYFLQVRAGAENKIFEWYTAEVANCGDGTGECSVTPETVLSDSLYNWRIQPGNEFGLGPWSDPMYFIVNTTDTEPPEPNVILDDDGNVIRIENLSVFNENSEVPTVYNVDFVDDTAFGVYGSRLDFDFPDDETIFLALEAVTDALNAENPVPPGAGPQGSDQFFIGNKEEAGLVVAVGGEIFSGVWDQCETACVAGVTLLSPTDPFAYADFTVVTAPPSGNVVQVFVTSLPHNGNFGELAGGDGLAGADQFCQNLAEEADLSGTWTAWLSDENTDARDRIPDGKYELLDGTVIANDLDDLTDGELEAPINLDETGGGGATPSVWTSTQPDGTTIDQVPPGDTTSNCQNWTSSESETGGCTNGDLNCAATGNTNEMDVDWTLNGGTANFQLLQCSGMASIYCFGGAQ